jgi:hypothetical protein
MVANKTRWKLTVCPDSPNACGGPQGALLCGPSAGHPCRASDCRVTLIGLMEIKSTATMSMGSVWGYDGQNLE